MQTSVSIQFLTFLDHSIVKLRLPEDNLIDNLTKKCEEKVFDMSPKDIALLGWCIARLELSHEHPLYGKTFRMMERYVAMLIDGVLQFKINDEIYTCDFDEQSDEIISEKSSTTELSGE